jgi:L-cysteine S-thiosulfotransferase
MTFPGRTSLLLLLAALMLAPVPVSAQERYSILPADRSNPLNELTSGYYFGSLKTRSVQDDDFDNPGVRWMEEGEAIWAQAAGSSQKSCATCHGKSSEAMVGVAAGYPKFDRAAGKVINIEQRINLCRQQQMAAPIWPFESKELLAMTVFVRSQSRGLPGNVGVDGPAQTAFLAGKREYQTKIGQYDLSCADCHDIRYGKIMDSQVLSQGHGNGFPGYNLRERTVMSLHRQFRQCNRTVRAEPREIGSDEYVALELYLAWRGNGLPIETPAVRP